MIAHVSKVFTSTATGKVLKPVACEKCSTAFRYELARMGTGRASAHYFLFQGAAKRRAERRAQKNLAKRLAGDVELVPCPSCKWVNDQAVQRYRKTQSRGWSVGAFAVFASTLALGMFLYFDAMDIANHPPSWTAPEVWVVGAVGGGITGVLLGIQALLRGRINPNVRVNGAPARAPGTPPALIDGADGAGVVAVAADPSILSGDVTTATFRAGQLILPPLCCECLDSATGTFRLPTSGKDALGVPICATCLARARKKFWLGIAGALTGSVAAGLLLVAIGAGLDKDGRWILGSAAAFMVFLTGLVIVDRSLRPFRLRRIDARRGVCTIAFRNPAYTALVVRAMGEAEGVFPRGGGVLENGVTD